MPAPKTDAVVAYTKPGSHHPAYINVTRKDDTVTVSLRGDARGDDAGPYVTVQFTFEEWRGFFQNLYAKI